MYTASKKRLTILLLLLLPHLGVADDVDILVKTSSQEANVLFIIDGSASMNNIVTNGTKTRMKVMQDTLKTVLATSPDYLSVGVMSYGTQDSLKSWDNAGDYPNGIKFPIKPIDEFVKPIIDDSLIGTPAWWKTTTLPAASTTTTVRDFIGQIADSWTPYGQTPIVDSLFEAARYYRGEGLKYGYFTGDELFASHPSTYVRPAPNEVKPLLSWSNDINDPDACDEVTNTIVSGIGVTQWDSGDTNNHKCPVDRLNPVGPGLASNCALTKHDCVSNTYPTCLEFNPNICIAWDENGDCSVTQGAGCKTWGPDKVINSCKFSYCKKVNKTPPNYISPITGECKSNNIILMSDGEPAYKTSAYQNVKPHSVDGGPTDVMFDILGNTLCEDAPSGFDEGRCGPELTEFLATNDNAPGAATPGDQFIDTLVIGFSSGITVDAENYLKSLVTIADDPDTAGKEGYFSASSEIELASAFKQAIQSIKVKDQDTYSTATYSVNTGISLTHGKYAYVPVFEHSGGSSWSGNLKKYEVVDNQLYGFDATGAKARATDNNGAFLEDINDLWRTSPSKNKVTAGGFANKITPATRNALTDNGSSIVPISSATKAQLAVTTTLEKDDLIKFIRGQNADDSSRHHMGDIIHSKPLQVVTSDTDSVLFIGTNEGYLHAIQASTGEELFAYMPKELLKNIDPQYHGTATANHIYGVDGQITLWHDDTNNNGIKEASEKATLFFGLRRGGQAYYALDITTIGSPKLLWKITPSTTGFSKLGFTWSTPKLEMLKYQSDTSTTLTTKPEPVLIFGGGYIDDHAASNNSGTGAGVYIVNAMTGKLLEKYSDTTNMGEVPGEIRAVDIDRNGSIDRLYFGDTKGNIWRVDLNESKISPFDLSLNKAKKLTQFAQLGGTDANDRSFFTEPDVALFKHKGKYAISVAMGTGLRPDPLNTSIEDHFFVLFDENVFNAPPLNHPAIMLNHLLNAPATSVDLVDNLNSPNSKKGWKLKLNSVSDPEPSGEKSLSTALTYQNKILFTTFSAKPDTSGSAVLPNSNTQSCGTSIVNTSKLYVLDFLTGGPALDLNGDSTIDGEDRWVGIGSGKIPETPQIRFDGYKAKNGGTCTNDDCAREQKIHAADKVIPLAPDGSLPRVYWINQKT